MEEKRATRNQLLNFLKGVGCIGVILIHVKFPGLFGEAVSQMAQFAVPVFIMIAGYYACDATDIVIKRRLIKICKIFLFAFCCWFIYRLLFQIMNSTALEWLKNAFSLKSLIKFVVFLTIDYAIPLWYLIGMVEVYIFWYVIVKKEKENEILRLIPVIFMLHFILTTYCESKGLDWSYKTNFITRALSWFMLGYYIHKNEDKIVNRYKDSVLAVTSMAGCIVALIPIVFDTKINFSCIGLFFYSVALFMFAVKHSDLSLSKFVEYMGDKLSLNIYVFHVLVAGVFTVVAKKVLEIDTDGEIFLWIKPLITIMVTIAWAFVLEMIKKGYLKKKNVKQFDLLINTLGGRGSENK